MTIFPLVKITKIIVELNPHSHCMRITVTTVKGREMWTLKANQIAVFIIIHSQKDY